MTNEPKHSCFDDYGLVVVVGVKRLGDEDIEDVPVGQLLIERDPDGRLREMTVEFFQGANESRHLIGDTMFFFRRSEIGEVHFANVESWSSGDCDTMDDENAVASKDLELRCEKVIARVRRGAHVFVVQYGTHNVDNVTPDDVPPPRRGSRRVATS